MVCLLRTNGKSTIRCCNDGSAKVVLAQQPSGVGVREIYETLLAPGKEIFPNGVPKSIPKVDFKKVAKVKVDPTGVKINGSKLK
jgi:hypothetical protein